MDGKSIDYCIRNLSRASTHLVLVLVLVGEVLLSLIGVTQHAQVPGTRNLYQFLASELCGLIGQLCFENF